MPSKSFLPPGRSMLSPAGIQDEPLAPLPAAPAAGARPAAPPARPAPTAAPAGVGDGLE